MDELRVLGSFSFLDVTRSKRETHRDPVLFPVHLTFSYRFRQKYLTTWQNSSDWNRWRGDFVFERYSSENYSTSVAMER
jgi:hypothetical protein